MIRTGSDSRLIDGLTVERVSTLENVRQRAGFDALDEIEQQLQIDIAGTAIDEITSEEVDVIFDVLFVNATEQRYSNLTIPHFTWGLSLTTETLIMATVAVMEWNIEDSEAISGARLAIGTYVPSSFETEFEGTIHLTFQGYGFPSDETAAIDMS